MSSPRITYKGMGEDQHQILLELDNGHLIAFLACIQNSVDPAVVAAVAKAIGDNAQREQACRVLGGLTLAVADMTEEIIIQNQPIHND